MGRPKKLTGVATISTSSEPPTECGGPYSMRRLPIKGWIVTGDGLGDAVTYCETDEHAKNLLLNIAQHSTFNRTADEHTINASFAAMVSQAIKTWGYEHWWKANKDAAKKFMKAHEPSFEIVRVVGAYICSYSHGMMVLKDIESVALYIDEFLQASNHDFAEEEAEANVGRLTPEELEALIRDAAQGASVDLRPASPTQKS